MLKKLGQAGTLSTRRGGAARSVFRGMGSESKYPWDYCKLVATILADEAFLPLSKSVCKLVKH
jgi:hypothetical protein